MGALETMWPASKKESIMPLSHKDEDSGLALSAVSPVSMIKTETVAAEREQSTTPARISTKTHFFMAFLHLSYRHYGGRNLGHEKKYPLW
jgi:hypothetical protein